MSGAWKNQERLVASWFRTRRNPLSGRNNFDDAGRQRKGDIIYNKAVIEVKRRKSVNMTVGIEIQKLAAGKPWLVFEFKTARSGSAPEAKMVKITCERDVAARICTFLDDEWSKQVNSNGEAL